MKFRVLAVCSLTLSLAQSLALAGPTRCAEGFQDSSCANSIAAAAQTPPACPASTATEVVLTQAAAVWQGSHFSAPVCAYYPEPETCEQQGYSSGTPGTVIVDPVWNATTDSWSTAQCSYTAAPACPSGQTQTSAPIWNGTTWVGQVCVANPTPVNPITLCTSEASGSAVEDALTSTTVPSSLFTQTGPFIQIPWDPDWGTTWNFGSYSATDGNGSLEISNVETETQFWLGIAIPQHSSAVTLYAAPYSGPMYNDLADNPWNGYVGYCIFQPDGTFAAFYLLPYSEQLDGS